MKNAIENPVTRFNTYEREEVGEVIRLFSKRKLVGELEIADVREDYEEKLPEFLLKERDFSAVEEFLTSEAGDEDEDGEGGGSIVPTKYRIKYGAPQNCGDDIALTLTGYVTEPRMKANGKADIDGGLNRDKLREVAKANGLADKLAKYEDRGLNGGLLRMNISNILRGMNRRGEKVVIGDKVYPAREVEKPKRVRKPKAKAAKPEAK